MGGEKPIPVGMGLGLLVEVIFRGVIQQGLVPVGKACAVQVDAVVHHMLSDAVEGVHQVYPRFPDFLVVLPGSGDPRSSGAGSGTLRSQSRR